MITFEKMIVLLCDD